MSCKDVFVSLIPEFYEKRLNEENFESVIFKILRKLFSFDSAYIFFINSDSYTLKYAYASKMKSKEISFEDFEKSFEHGAYIADLRLENFSFAKFVIVSDRFSKEEEEVFTSVASIIGNLIKDMELTSILKMQVQALQEGIDEVNELYDTVRAQNKKIVKSDKIKNEFLASVSHQLRSPLNSIIGFSDMLSEGVAGTLNEMQKGYINDIKIAGIKLLEMINEILDLSKIEAKAMKLFLSDINIRQNICEVLNILKPLYMEKNIKVDLDIPDDICIWADYSKIQQVFFNLIANAIKFTQVDGRIVLSACVDKKFVNISVKDNGIGIAKENHKKIFNKFEQFSTSSSPSTGLGLTVVKEIVKLHGGKISVNSELGKGAEFIVSLRLS